MSRVAAGRRSSSPPTLDHPGFVVTAARGSQLELEFRGSVHDPYFQDAALEIVSARRSVGARVVALDAKAKPFKRVIARLTRTATACRSATSGGFDSPRMNAFRGSMPDCSKLRLRRSRGGGRRR
jgi:hypothetical protein